MLLAKALASISMVTNVDNFSIQNCEIEKMQNQLSELLGQMKKLPIEGIDQKKQPFEVEKRILIEHDFFRRIVATKILRTETPAIQEAVETFNNTAKDCIRNIRITSNRIILKEWAIKVQVTV